jgi:hypothetical protein
MKRPVIIESLQLNLFLTISPALTKRFFYYPNNNFSAPRFSPIFVENGNECLKIK